MVLRISKKKKFATQVTDEFLLLNFNLPAFEMLFLCHVKQNQLQKTHALEGGWAGFHQESFDAHKAEILLELDKNHKNFVFEMFPMTEIEFGKLSDLPHDGYVFVEAKQVSRWNGVKNLQGWE